MKIAGRDQELQLKEQEDQYKKLNSSYEKKIRAREKEIKAVEELYDKKAQMASLEGEDQYIQALDRNSKRIVGVSKEFEDKIQSYKDRLRETQKKVETEEETLKSSEQSKITGLKKNLENNFQEKYQASVEEQQYIENSTKNAIAEISSKSLNDRRAIESKAQFDINALSDDYGKKVMDTESNYRAKLENDLKKQKHEGTKQQEELKLNMLEETHKLTRLGTEKNRIQNDQMNLLEKHQQNMIKQKTDDFKARYEKLVVEHDTIIKDLEKELHADMKKMMEKSATEKKSVANKVDDHFYQIEKLAPVVVESPTDVEVSLEIPEHEKENFHLSAQGRNIKMTLSRKFSDSITAPDGSLNKSTRSELFSKDVTTKDLLNSNKITQKYENGLLTYKVLKA